MTERDDILQDCLSAFAAIPSAKASRRLLKTWGLEPAAWAGDGRTILADYMVKKIRERLTDKAQTS